MPLKATSRGTRRVPSTPVGTKKTSKVIFGDIASLRQILTHFEKELFDLKKLDMDKIERQIVDDTSRRLRMILLLKEFSALSVEETVLSTELRCAAHEVHARVIASLTQTETPPASAPVPMVAPEAWKARANRKENPGEFIERVYGFCLHNLALRDIRRLDYKLYTNLSVWRSKGNELPSGVQLKTEKELNDLALQEHGFLNGQVIAPDREALRLAKVISSRKQRHMHRNSQ